MALKQVNRWSGTVAAGVVDALPDDWDEAVEHMARCAGRVVRDVSITPRVVDRAYTFLYAAFPDAAARQELQFMTVAEVVEWYLNL